MLQLGAADLLHRSANSALSRLTDNSKSSRRVIIINNNTNNNHDNVYGAIIMTKVIARVRPVHLMNVD